MKIEIYVDPQDVGKDPEDLFEIAYERAQDKLELGSWSFSKRHVPDPAYEEFCRWFDDDFSEFLETQKGIL